MAVGRRVLLVTICVLGMLAGAGAVKPAPPTEPAAETEAQRDARMRWWREARFGMFIHWGVYAVPAGYYHGQPVGGAGEWLMRTANIPTAEYQQFAGQFNPTKYDPEAWVRLAKEAGQKYLVITSKHHDGFTLFNSAASPWGIGATPYGQDLLKPLAAACRKYGIKLGFYYSQAQDWNNPGGAAHGGHWDKAQDGDFDEYLRRVAVPQVREILTGYGPIAVLWFDTPVDMTPERAALLTPLLKLQPGIIVNNRLGGGFRGDLETPEQQIPATGLPGRDWETCMTMNNTWGYKRDDQHWKSPETLIRNLVDIASKGGNYLLNVGPTAEGEIPAASVERLQAMGRWMKVNGEAIYATTASPFKHLAWGRCTKKVDARGATLFLHVFSWPTDGKLLLPGLLSETGRAWLLADPKHAALPIRTGEEGVTITLPATAPDPISSTVVLQVRGALTVEPQPLTPGADGTLKAPASDATIHGETLRYESGHERDNLGFWMDPADWAEWPLKLTRAGRYTVSAEVASPGGGGTVELSVGDAKLRLTAPATGDYGKFQTVTVGTLELPAGRQDLLVVPVVEDWKPINLKAITLKPEAPTKP